ncbi:hypothetical protein M758_10G090200 [Ceratodon purpureus]|uniref:Uncharacterized protein n=1 Tax=Ceratodon purpureus TaxID=3225 RepID=A0A8T0GM12_CERPU|nr:hypothetical protein M758_N024300 [Ceratodon purpureus]KAG0559264.1 hypothetical protein KC19_10G091800 [Ceratodon purpureus]KAG0603392.1 hypothetical protein M758_10G090200 [Ceratodon purpureus]
MMIERFFGSSISRRSSHPLLRFSGVGGLYCRASMSLQMPRVRVLLQLKTVLWQSMHPHLRPPWP